jgi:hypothetical protein
VVSLSNQSEGVLQIMALHPRQACPGFDAGVKGLDQVLPG